MFKPNPDNMRMEATPERVLAVCRILALKSMSHEELRKLMTLSKEDDNSQSEINQCIETARSELGLIQSKDNLLEYVGASDVIASPVHFRRYVAASVFSRKDTTFYKFSSWYLSKNEEPVLINDWEAIAGLCSSEVPDLKHINHNAALGWRFWAAFLGLGYLNGAALLPNMKTRLQDLLATDFPKFFQYGDLILAHDFIDWLRGKLPETAVSSPLPLAISAALRTLHELKLITLTNMRDANRVFLYYVNGELVNEFSHITVSEEVCR